MYGLGHERMCFQSSPPTLFVQAEGKSIDLTADAKEP